MLKKIQKEIAKLEQQKGVKTEKKIQLEEEISALESSLKELYSLKSKYEKLEENAQSYLKNLSSM